MRGFIKFVAVLLAFMALTLQRTGSIILLCLNDVDVERSSRPCIKVISSKSKASPCASRKSEPIRRSKKPLCAVRRDHFVYNL